MTITWCGVSRRTDITQALAFWSIQGPPARSRFSCFQNDIDPAVRQRCTAARNFACLGVLARSAVRLLIGKYNPEGSSG